MNTIEEHEDLCLESKTKFFFEKHTESSERGRAIRHRPKCFRNKRKF